VPKLFQNETLSGVLGVEHETRRGQVGSEKLLKAGKPTTADMDHRYIDDNNVPEKYLANELTEDMRAAFADHAVSCEECWDRLQLAQMWLEHQGQQHGQHQGQPQPPVFAGAHDNREAPSLGLFDEETVTAAAMTYAHSGGAAAEFRSETSTALTLTVRHWQIPTLTTLAAMLAVSLEYIHQQQIELARRDNPAKLPKMAQFVLQFEPWQLLLIGALAALVLVMLPATWFFWELKQLSWR
jgi:hypothetical protein